MVLLTLRQPKGGCQGFESRRARIRLSRETRVGRTSPYNDLIPPLYPQYFLHLIGCPFQFQSFPHMLGYGRCSVAAEEGLHETRLGRPSRDYDLIPSCVHSSFVNFPGVNLSFNNSLTRSGTVVLLPLLRTVVSRSTSFVKSPYMLQIANTYPQGLTWSKLQIPAAPSSTST